MKRALGLMCTVVLALGCIADPDDGETGAGGDDGAGGVSAMGGASGAGGDPGMGGEPESGGEPGMGGAGGDGPSIREPLRHRPVAEACDRERPAGNGVGNDRDSVECNADEDCADGENGRCIQHRDVQCTYDSCFDDSACGGFACECEGGWGSDHNICLNQGNCLVNADCGEGGYCSPSLGDCGDYGGTVGYFCHTPEDECIDDADCGGASGESDNYCKFNPAVGHWTCDNAQCVG